MRAHILHTRVSHPTTPDFNLGRNFGGIIDLDQSGTIDFDRGYGVLHIHLPKPAELAKKQQKIEIKKA